AESPATTAQVASAQSGRIPAVDAHGAGARAQRRVQDAQEGGFAGTGRAEDRDPLAPADVQAHVVPRLHAAGAARLHQANALQLEAHLKRPAPSPPSPSAP